MKEMFSVREAAAFMDCSEDTIRRRLAAGTLRYTRTGPGGHYRIHRDALLTWVPEPRPRAPRPVKGEAAGWVRGLRVKQA